MDKKRTGFAQPPLSPEKKEQHIKKILAEVGGRDPNETSLEERDTSRVTITMRVPKYYVEDIERIRKLTGQTKNSIYIELFRNAIKQKLKELLTEK